jgi:membrane-bound lytic murein transglycosylase D
MIWVVGVVAFASGCVTSSGDRESVDLGEGQTPEPSADATVKPIKETPENKQLFCPDDIYGRYLADLYRSRNPDRMITTKTKVVRTVGEGKKRRKKASFYSRDQGENEALTYASGIINGPATASFGGSPVQVNEEVAHWINHFTTKGRGTFLRWLSRGEALRESVKPLLRQHGVPAEIFYLAMIESGFNHGAKSHAKAVGTWQFMKGTAKLYGLRMDRYVDERRDPVKATVAAASYLRDLHAEFGDWNLAMAAYNAGPGRIAGALRKSGAGDYWSLVETAKIPLETKQYVPKVMAAMILATNAGKYGFSVVSDKQDSMPETTVNITTSTKLRKLASTLGVSVEQIKRWNPELVGDATPPQEPGSAGYPLRLPPKYVALLKRGDSGDLNVSVTKNKAESLVVME